MSRWDTRMRDRSPAYGSYRAMLRRCYDPNHRSYPDYGARGIRVFFDWMPGDGEGYAAFLRDMGERPAGHHLARRDPDGPYDPWNCYWETAAANVAERNARVCGRHDELVEVDGRALTRRGWARELGISYRTLCRREQRGWGEDAYRVRVGKRRKSTGQLASAGSRT